MRNHIAVLIVATGNGKGKTTAAIGQAVRAMGHGRRVFFAQFIKSDGFPSGEDRLLRTAFGDQLTFLKGGRGFVGICGDTLPFAEHRAAALATLDAVREAVASGSYGLLVLDEANVAMALKLIAREEMDDFLAAVPVECDVVITGRGADESIISRADFVTECVEVKHPFHSKVPAKKGIEY